MRCCLVPEERQRNSVTKELLKIVLPPWTLVPEVTGQKAPGRVPNYRERLALVAAGGQTGWYGLLAHGTALTASHIEELDDSEIERLYARIEVRLGAAMTKTLGSAALKLYAGMASMFLPIPAENQPGLIADLEADPFVGHALSSTTCELYHRYGMFLAPLAAGHAPKVQDKPPQLKACPDPHYMV